MLFCSSTKELKFSRSGLVCFRCNKPPKPDHWLFYFCLPPAFFPSSLLCPPPSLLFFAWWRRKSLSLKAPATLKSRWPSQLLSQPRDLTTVIILEVRCPAFCNSCSFPSHHNVQLDASVNFRVTWLVSQWISPSWRIHAWPRYRSHPKCWKSWRRFTRFSRQTYTPSARKQCLNISI